MPQFELRKPVIQSFDVLKDSALLAFKHFFPLFIGWAATLGGPVLLLCIGTVTGQIIDRMLWGMKQAGPATLVGLLIPGAVIGWCWAGWNYLTLKIARGEPTKFSDLFRPMRQVISGLVVLVISSFFIGLGMFLVIPGALLYLKWQLAPFYVVDQDFGPIEALRKSWHETNDVFMELALVDLAFAGLQAVSGVTIIGPVFVHMIMGVASATVYTRWIMEEHYEPIAIADS